MAELYKKVLARNHVNLEMHPGSGGWDNVKLLLDLNTVHFSTLIAFLMSIGGSGLSVRRRNGKLLILRLTPRGLRRLRLEETSSSRISSSTAS